MTSPYGSIQHAVAGYASVARSRSPDAATGAAGPAPTFTGFEPAVGVYDSVRAQLVATYPAAGYPRHLECLSVECSQAVPVHLYVGAISATSRISSYGDGSLADYSPPIPRWIPEGAPLLVVWEVTSSTATGSASAQLRQATR